MTKYTHKLFKHTYIATEAAVGGVIFKVIETGETRFLTDHQIVKMIEPA